VADSASPGWRWYGIRAWSKNGIYLPEIKISPFLC
jgi:hypothetical protein